MNLTIPALETEWRGYRFRSRCEARWAVFFDALGIPFEYEKEGFDLPSGRYLPDFWLPRQRIWAEVKGYGFSAREDALCRELCESTDRPVLLLNDTPDLRAYKMYHDPEPAGIQTSYMVLEARKWDTGLEVNWNWARNLDPKLLLPAGHEQRSRTVEASIYASRAERFGT